mmetsp:Transcript_13646/g.23982  ORF Transcript_13646/g.23982 Transcript_13646/m.23982 type:complete len:500 (-) Transcript_13646:384-1883(-)|eukprot:CAMPEP_0119104974 /NCGR_PEP_ID=MMETSP1180-20130426/3050_1 /TAXON_ID=3052 ORGANISM="Chlamydomonas cf sp, Strain CCMP681" /NCGR_SAMPLE_ID=MMETSP1180 /ASSEMBLY_ACC=CAM_ASM_000741 /LENGTH=499 /DNA_ID=CAMNT_0007089879 /DNA_START=23 /DNA_END=1522 /DNA_ORIENTATION=+
MAGDKDSKAAAVPAPSDSLPEVPKPASTLKAITVLLENAVKLKESRLVSGRVMRLAASVRPHLTPSLLREYVIATLAVEVETRPFLLATIDQLSFQEESAAMQTDEATGAPAPVATPAQAKTLTPEVELFAFLLLTMHLMDVQNVQLAKDVVCRSLLRLSALNRRTADVIAARLYSFYSLTHERLGQLEGIRSSLLALHRTAHLRHDVMGQEMLLNLLLRNYLHYNLYDQAEKFRSKAQRADVWRSHHQYCRYLYYLGRIRAVQLQYSEARDCLQQASRKAPLAALAFRASADKWLVLVRLLLGEVPERAEFSVHGLAALLRPYYELTQAVRSGDLVAFAQVAALHDAVFSADGVRNLVTRLHHNVLRTGLRRISLAYSRISLADVAARLHVPSAEDAESLVAKAIRDGGLEGYIDHEAGALVSRAAQDVYVSAEPAEAFHVRVAFCLDLHNDAVKALRYEPDSHRKKLETAESRAERLAVEAELAEALDEADEGDDGF